MLNIITYKDISKQEVRQYLNEYGIGIYDKTLKMVNAETNKHYYSLTSGGCACEFYQNEPDNGYKLIDLLEDCLKYGELILFFYLDNGDYKYIANDVHTYINQTKKINISFDDFLDTFMNEEFNGSGIVYNIIN